jgi:glycerate 2-kinase
LDLFAAFKSTLIRAELMKVLIACDKFKGTLSSSEVGGLLAQSIQTLRPDWQVHVWPVSDGGEGFLAALEKPLQLQFFPVEVQSAWGSKVVAQIGWQQNTRSVYLESCQALGLHLIPAELRHPLKLNSEGLGELILASLGLKPLEIWIGLGSSGTIDAGLGVAKALGYKFFDRNNKPLPALPHYLPQLDHVLAPQEQIIPQDCKLKAICDVLNPFAGSDGGIRVYGPQKGANEIELEQLEKGLQKWAQILCRDLNLQISSDELMNSAGSGAAGGMGLGLQALLNAELIPGSNWLLSAIGLESELNWADCLITGEGQFDLQSEYGKWPARLVAQAQDINLPVVLITGKPILGALPSGILADWNLESFQIGSQDSIALSKKALEQVGSAIIGKLAKTV